MSARWVRPTLLLVLSAILAHAPSPAGAASLTPFEDLRFVSSDVPSLPLAFCGPVTPSPSFSRFVAHQGCISGDATQDSTVSATELAGTGGVFTTGGGRDVEVESHYEIRFGVTESTPFTFDFEASWLGHAASMGANPRTEIVASLTPLIGLPVPVFGFDLPFTIIPDSIPLLAIDGQRVFRETGVLVPGQYRLIVSMRADREVSVIADYDFSLVVPEPSTALLLGTGLVWLGSAQRRGARARAHEPRS